MSRRIAVFPVVLPVQIFASAQTERLTVAEPSPRPEPKPAPVPDPVMDDETVLLLSVLLPVVAAVLTAFVVSSIVSSSKPVWTSSESEHLRRRWPSDEPLLQDLRMVRNSEAGRRKILNHVLFEATKAQSGDEPCRLLSPDSLHALEPNVFMRWLMSEQLILAYTMLSAEQVAECICAAFIASPAEALLGGVDLATCAKRAAEKYTASQPQFATKCEDLSEEAQKTVRSLLWVLAQQDLHQLVEMKVGVKVWHAAKGEGLVCEHLFDPAPRICVQFPDGKISRYAKHSWDKLSTSPPAITPEETQKGDSGPANGAAKGDPTSPSKPPLVLRDSQVFRSALHSATADGSDDLMRLIETPVGQRLLNDIFTGELMVVVSLPELQDGLHKRWIGMKMTDPFLRTPSLAVKLRMQGLLTVLRELQFAQAGWVILKLLLLPFLAIYPPLAKTHTIFHFSPQLKWQLQQLIYLTYLAALTGFNLPLSGGGSRFEPFLIRDVLLLLHSLAAMLGELLDAASGGSLELYFRDPINTIIELPAHVLTFSALLINLIGGHFLEQSHLASAGRGLFAVGVVLQWARLLRPLQITEKFGASVLMMLRMGNDIIEFLVLFLVLVLAFCSGLYALYKDPDGSADAELLAKMAPCPNWDEAFDTWFTTFLTLMEAMLAQDGDTQCFRATSQPQIGTMIIYTFMLVAVLMLVNMLIAMMAKTFDAYHGSSRHYLFIRARTINDLHACEPQDLPPFNLLSRPYAFLSSILQACSMCSSEAAATENCFSMDRNEGKKFWLGSLESLTNKVKGYEVNNPGRVFPEITQLRKEMEIGQKQVSAMEDRLASTLDAVSSSMARLEQLMARRQAEEPDSTDAPASSKKWLQQEVSKIEKKKSLQASASTSAAIAVARIHV